MAGTNTTSVRTYSFYAEGTTPNTNAFADAIFEFVDMPSGREFTSQAVILANDNAGGGANIQFSFDGTTNHGTLKAGEKLVMDFKRATKIHLRSSAASVYRLYVW